MRLTNRTPRRAIVGCLVLGALLSSCAAPRVATVPTPAAVFNPTGDWEYFERGQSVLLSLDAEGNGSYPWRGGRIITTAVEGITWRGIWQQPDNDREGGFELRLSRDHQRAEGTWWYTRIGDNNNPNKKGGKFGLIRLPNAESKQQGTATPY